MSVLDLSVCGVSLWSFVPDAEAIDLYPQGSFQPSGLLDSLALMADEPRGPAGHHTTAKLCRLPAPALYGPLKQKTQH